MVTHPLVDDLVGHILGEDFILSTHSANIAKPGGVRMGLHTDQWWMPQPVKAGEDYIKPSEISRSAASSFLKKPLRASTPSTKTTVTCRMLESYTRRLC